MSVAFVLSGGASLGSVQVGMLQALLERGVVPDLVLGASVGAVNGAFVATRPPTRASADGLAEVWHAMGTTTIFPVDPLAGLKGLLGLADHFVPQRGLRDLIDRNKGAFARLEEAPIPLHVVATDAQTGHDVLLSAGDATEAVLASAAIPGVYPTVAWHGRRLMDGGMANNTPISHALALGATEVWVLPSGFACALEHAPRGALAAGVHALTTLIGARLAADVERQEPRATITVLPPPCPITVTPVDFGRTRELIVRSRALTAELLDAGRRGSTDAAALLLPHAHPPAVIGVGSAW